MAVDKITPNDPRIKHEFAEVNGHRWHYLDAAPKGAQRGTVFLVHGFPDLSLAWRYQIPMLTELGLRCIAIDCMGYGDTGTSANLQAFGFKSHADAIAGIAARIGASRIILGGHDWGGAAVYRIAQWYPDLVTHVFSVCTPYFGVSETYVSTEQLVKGPVPQFGYQLQFGSEDEKVERVVKDKASVRKFLNGLYGGRVPGGKKFMDPRTGIDLSIIENDEVGMTPLLNQEELDFYISQFTKTGVHGPCNWYRTRRVNFDDERSLPATQRSGVSQPTLFIQALSDGVLTPDLAKGLDKAIPSLTRGEVPASHWALWHTPKETNEIIRGWVEGVVFGGKSKI